MSSPRPASPSAPAYGVHYTPDSQQAHTLAVDRLSELGIRYVRITWLDLTNVARLRVLPLAYFLRLLAAPRPAISMIRGALGVVFLALADGFTSAGEYLYRPDLGSIRLCPHAPGHAAVMGWYEEKVPVPGADGVPTLTAELCPRATLARVLDEARAAAGVAFLVGFEVEFILLTSVAPITAVSSHHWSAAAALPAGASHTVALEEIADALQAAGIELQMYHPEAAPGQYEVVTGPLPPLAAADALVHTRATITNIAAKHALRATFAPRVYATAPGVGLHTHISVHPAPGAAQPALPASPSPHLTPPEASFLAGLLPALPALSLLTLPLPASYARVGDGAWSGGTYVAWGTDVREAPVRLCNAAAPRARNFELRAVDGTANPYVALAGVLGAGAQGVRRGAALRVQDCSVRLPAQGEHGEHHDGAPEHTPPPSHGAPSTLEPRAPFLLTPAERARYGITARLPLTWDVAREALQGSALVREVLGDKLVEAYLSVNKLAAETYDAPETEEDRLRMLVENY